MAYIKVPADMSKVKNKVIMGMTKRQLISFGVGLAVAIPALLISRNILGGGNLPLIIFGILLAPSALFAMYERDGIPFEMLVAYKIRKMFYFPKKRLYRTENRYEYLAWLSKYYFKDDINQTSKASQTNQTSKANQTSQQTKQIRQK